MTFYVVDTTLNPPQTRQFEYYTQIVKYLEEMCQRTFGQSRKSRMLMLEEIGYGYDDTQGVSFVRSMAEKFNMGIYRNDAGNVHPMRCDIANVALYQNEDFGN
jgi:hypothetical protein